MMPAQFDPDAPMATDELDDAALAAADAGALRRRWPVILALFLLAPITAEVLSGSTPLLEFARHPVLAVINLPLYGCGVLLVREVARRRGLGWAGVLWLGAAYGIWEEGVVINTWANPWAPVICSAQRQGLCDYGRVGGVSVLWALSLTAFHAVVSITIPILLVELARPRLAPLPWLTRGGLRWCVAGELFVLLLGLLLSLGAFRDHGQLGPPWRPYAIELALMAACVALALLPRWPASRGSSGALPSLWTLRLLGCLALTLDLFLPNLEKGLRVPYQAAMAINVAVLALALWRLATWSRRAGWGQRHILALATGVLGFLIVLWDPLLELAGQASGKPTRGTAVVAALYLIGLIALARVVARRERHDPVFAR
ncbi:MAG TPA: hypothetical protein VGR57_13095 [Ktedonobacterales bacterium]|nr:hypothetical protein [Ktedonobacterales bacterium]